MPTIYSSSNDGHIEAHSGLSFATNRDATSGTAINSSSTRDSIAVAAQKFSGRGGTTYRLRRVFFDFDTSGISVTPSSAIFKLYGYLKNVASFFVVKSTQSASLSAGNFDAITGWTAGADNSSNVTKYSSEISSMNTSGYEDITLNATALSDMASLDTFKICLIESTSDLANIAPTNFAKYTGMHFIEYTGISSDPYIDYTEAATDNATFFGANF